MSPNWFRIAELFYKQKIGLLDDTEAAELQRWIQETESHHALAGKIMSRKTDYAGFLDFKKIADEESWKCIESRINRERHIRRYLMRSVATAALLISVGISLYLPMDTGKKPGISQTVQYSRHQATLHLADGKTVLLDGSHDKIETAEAVISQTGSKLEYNAKSIAKETKNNSLSTPAGGVFDLILADGTKVWLNAASRLTYPEVFVDSIRQVQLSGEAYFEVAKSPRKPFIVHTADMDIRVLGTHFNIKAYPEQPATTTLAEGSVQLVSHGISAILQPDQQGVFSEEENNFRIKAVDASNYTVWRKGLFIFNRESLENIMYDIARWYDIEPCYQEEDLKKILFTGEISFYPDIRDLLSALEKTEKIKFRLETRKLHIYR